jgi:hypothetical protein
MHEEAVHQRYNSLRLLSFISVAVNRYFSIEGKLKTVASISKNGSFGLGATAPILWTAIFVASMGE